MQATKPLKKRAHLQRNQPLDVFFSPKTVAVIGATENPGSVGRTILWNLVTSPFGGTVYPVNPKRPSVLGVKAYPSISDIPEEVDLAVHVAPPATHAGRISARGPPPPPPPPPRGSAQEPRGGGGGGGGQPPPDRLPP